MSEWKEGDFGFQVSFDGSVGVCSEESADNREADVGPGEAIQIGLDWLEATVRPVGDTGLSIDQVQLAVTVALGAGLGDWVQMEHGVHGYRSAMVGPGGGQIWWDAPDRLDIHFSLPGKACRIAGQARLRHLLAFTLAHGGKGTRCAMTLVTPVLSSTR